MVRKASSSTKRGRPPSFDREEVVAAATRAFWQKGFADTSLGDLETATGVDRSTMYNSFGGKQGLYDSATDAYLEEAESTLFQSLSSGSAGVADILTFLDRLTAGHSSGTAPRGCLIVNDVVSPTGDRATSRYLKDLEGGLLAALERSGALGETDSRKASDRARLVTAAVLGINLVHGGQADPATALTLITSLRAEVASWLD
jgi:TetR/AcrR family transcriptional repressor of nem operon